MAKLKGKCEFFIKTNINFSYRWEGQMSVLQQIKYKQDETRKHRKY